MLILKHVINLKNHKMERILNLETITTIDIVEEKVCNYIDYKPYKKSFWGDTKEGFYGFMEDRCYTKEEIENGYYLGTKLIVKDKVAYYKPYVTLTLISGTKHHKEFNTYKEASEWGNDIAGKSIKARLVL